VQKQIRRIIRPDVLGTRFNIKPELVKKLVLKGYPLIAWTVDDPQMAHNLYAWGVKGLHTNKPLVIESCVQRHQTPLLDAGGQKARIHEIVHVNHIQDIQKTLCKARKAGKKINVGGRRHSMGGQTLGDDGIFLNMLPFNAVTYHKDRQTVTAQAGATWQKIQEVLSAHGKSIKVMQSDNIFTLGGSISVNVHGWQVGQPPIASTIKNMTVMTADGKIEKISPTINPELFHAVTGGYGMFAIIIDAELETTDNTLLQFHALFTDAAHFDALFQEKVTKNPGVELAYGRLSSDQNHLFEQAGLFWFTRKNPVASNHAMTTAMKEEKMVALKRGLFRLSQYHNLWKKLRWSAEKTYATMMAQRQGSIRRNDAMNSDTHILWPLYGTSKDILQEYFIPKNKFYDFLKILKALIIKYKVNILNVTIREVRKDTTSLLPYAKKDVLAFVCLFSQAQTVQDEGIMQEFTQAITAKAIALGGTFYLPYRLHYTGKALLAAYPEIRQWLAVKKRYDPEGLFYSHFYAYIHSLVSQAP
jgi:FAD/FMN-containing dehydrogenase